MSDERTESNSEQSNDGARNSRAKNYPSSAEIEADNLTSEVLATAIELHKALGPGRRESVYRQGLMNVLRADGVRVAAEKSFDIELRGEVVGTAHVDLWVEEQLVIEVKAVQQLRHAHLRQLGRYVETAGVRRGLLLNFGNGRLEIQRFTNFDARIPDDIKSRMEH